MKCVYILQEKLFFSRQNSFYRHWCWFFVTWLHFHAFHITLRLKTFTFIVNGKKRVKIRIHYDVYSETKTNIGIISISIWFWSSVWRCAFIRKKVRKRNRAPRLIRTAAKCSLRVFIGLCIRTNRVRMRMNVRLRLRWCTDGWAGLMFVFYLSDGNIHRFDSHWSLSCFHYIEFHTTLVRFYVADICDFFNTIWLTPLLFRACLLNILRSLSSLNVIMKTTFNLIANRIVMWPNFLQTSHEWSFKPIYEWKDAEIEWNWTKLKEI